jgi:diguanylate cyclase (GGDEF)-like protein/PAS domain S-box-containing protein
VKIQFLPGFVLLVAVAPLALFLAWRSWRGRAVPGALPFVIVTLLAGAWALGSALELASVDLATKLMWADAQYLFIVFLPVALLAMVLDYTGHRSWLTRQNLLTLALLPLLTLALMWTNGQHHLMRADAWLETTGTYRVVGRAFGPWFWVHAAYSYALMATALGFLVASIFTTPPVYRRQPILLLLGLLLPITWNLLYLARPQVLPVHDFTPAAFAAAGLVFAWGLFRIRLFTLVPVARHTLVENMSDGVLVLDEADRVADINEAARALIGRPAEQILARPIAESWEAWSQLAAPYAAEAGLATLSLGEDGGRRDYEVKISRLARRDQVLGRLLVIRDVTERAVLEENLRAQALTDSLTGLANRALFMAKLSDAVHQAKRRPDRPFAIIILDLDRFKQINDSIGHLAGDVLLEHVADRIRHSVREVDTVARLGGDEFMVLLDQVGGLRDVVPIIERIREELRTPVPFGDHEMYTTASMGVVMWDPSYRDPEDLLRAADTAMYQAKEAGRDCYRMFDEQMHRAVLRTIKAETDLRAALKHGDFCLEYQPVVDVETGMVSSLEALVRWNDPRRGLVAPKDFIDVAESSGLILPLGELVLDEVCGQISRWRIPSHPAFQLPVSLNLSPRQLTETDFVGTILTRMAEWRIAPGSLIFEVTEAALQRDPAKAKQMLGELCGMGMRVCLDDFGTGCSSLQHLTDFPVNEIKIDRLLVARIAESDTDREIARSVTGLAHTLGLKVTGEGVENSAQWRLLQELGCDRLQGYYVCPPLEPAELEKSLEEMAKGLRPAGRGPRVEQTLDEVIPVEAGPAGRRSALKLVHEQPRCDHGI